MTNKCILDNWSLETAAVLIEDGLRAVHHEDRRRPGLLTVIADERRGRVHLLTRAGHGGDVREEHAPDLGIEAVREVAKVVGF